MKSEKLYIILPVHNRVQLTSKFLDCLLEQTYRNYHLILVDDGSKDGTSEKVEATIPRDQLTVLRGDGSLWWAGALQKAYEYLIQQKNTDEDSVLIINDDTDFGPEFLEKGLSRLTHHNLLQAMACDGSYLNCEGGVYADLKRLTFVPTQDPKRINCLSTRGLLLKFTTFRGLGGFYPEKLPHYLSDYEYTIRARQKGFLLEVDPQFKLVMNQETTGVNAITRRGVSYFLKTVFTNRYTGNPLHWSFFIVKTCPPLWVPFNIARVWTVFIRGLISSIVRQAFI